MRITKLVLGAVAIWLLGDAASILAQTPPPNISQPDWGEIIKQTNGTGEILLKVKDWPKDGKFKFPLGESDITSASVQGNHVRWERIGLGRKFTFSSEASNRVSGKYDANEKLYVQVEIPASGVKLHQTADIILETAERTQQFAGGRIVFGPMQPGFDLSFFSTTNHSIRWDFKPTRWGMYDAEVAFFESRESYLPLDITIAGHNFKVTPPVTEGALLFKTMPLGRFYLEKSEPFSVEVVYHEARNRFSVIHALTLRPAPEGGPISQMDSGAVSLPASNGITHSVMMRYEPAKIKNCMGYWVNPADWAEWIFEIKKPGTFEVEVWQGCGKGSGGSDVVVEAGGKRLPFVVEDTGHFQNFVPRRVGQVTYDKPGSYSLAVKVARQQAGAIMDIREVKLLPVEKN